MHFFGKKSSVCVIGSRANVGIFQVESRKRAGPIVVKYLKISHLLKSHVLIFLDHLFTYVAY